MKGDPWRYKGKLLAIFKKGRKVGLKQRKGLRGIIEKRETVRGNYLLKK
ncbi:MAG: hypothetical protein ACTSVO_11945 [Candidatus Heimdallarchaeaceae archaeon]